MLNLNTSKYIIYIYIHNIYVCVYIHSSMKGWPTVDS